MRAFLSKQTVVQVKSIQIVSSQPEVLCPPDSCSSFRLLLQDRSRLLSTNKPLVLPTRCAGVGAEPTYQSQGACLSSCHHFTRTLIMGFRLRVSQTVRQMTGPSQQPQERFFQNKTGICPCSVACIPESGRGLLALVVTCQAL